MIPRPSPTPWWFFFPIVGFEIADQENPLEQPLFGDATILSFRDIQRLGKKPFFNERDYRYSTYVGVRLTTILNIKWFDEERDNERRVREARQRATEVVGFLTLLLMMSHEDGSSCYLADDLLSRTTHFILWNQTTDQHMALEGHEGVGSTFFFASESDDEPVFTMDNLRTFCAMPALKGLYTAMLRQKTKLGRTLRESLVQSILRFNEALNAPSYAMQLLGAYTCIELLLTDTGKTTPTAVIEARLKWLIGESIVADNRYASGKVFKARHDYVHRGQSLESRRLALCAMALAVAALCRYGILILLFEHKDALLAYLDLYRMQRQRVKDSWLTKALEASPAFALLDVPSDLAVFHFIDKTFEFDEEWEVGLYDRTDRVFERPEDDTTRSDA